MPIRVEEEESTIWLLKRTVHMEILYCLDSTWYSFLFRYFVWKLPSTTFFCLKNNSLRLFHSSTSSGSSAKLAQVQHTMPLKNTELPGFYLHLEVIHL